MIDGVVFADRITGGVIPREYIGAVATGIRNAAKSGILGGYSLVNVMVELVDGSHHEVDSSTVAFEQAGALAFREACTEAGLALLEPIMKVTIVTPDDYFGPVSADLASRRGQIVETQLRGKVRVITAVVQLGRHLEKAGLLHHVDRGAEEAAGYSLAKPPDQIPITELIELGGSLHAGSAANNSQPEWVMLERLTQAQRDAVRDQTLASMIAQS